jgi:gluconate kinase
MLRPMLVRAVWLNGTVGAGKTTVGEHLAELLSQAGEAVAFINTDDLGRCWPRPTGDPFNVDLLVRNLTAVASNYVRAGARTVVVAGVVQTNDQLGRFSSALETAPALVRLTVPADEVSRRLRRRHGEFDEAGLRWHLARAPELDGLLDISGLPSVLVENTGPPAATAQAVLASLDWPLVTQG